MSHPCARSLRRANVAEYIGEQRLLECLSLCLRVAGYIAIEISGHAWPTEADVRDIADRGPAPAPGFALPDAPASLARAALGFEPLAEVFPDRQKLVSATIFTTAA